MKKVSLNSLKCFFKEKILKLYEQKKHYNMIDPAEQTKIDLKSDRLVITKVMVKSRMKKPNNYTKNSVSLEIYESTDETKFNFTKIDLRQIMFVLRSEDEILIDDEQKIINLFNEKKLKDYDAVVPNIFPLLNRHFLFLPYYQAVRPQYLNDRQILVSLMNFLIKFDDSNFLMGYNSKGASSSINHLHFQLIYNQNTNILSNFEADASVEEIYSDSEGRVKLEFFRNDYYKYFKFCFVRQEEKVHHMIDHLHNFLAVLHLKKLPYNMVIYHDAVYVFIRRHENLVTERAFAFLEIIGYVYHFEQSSFDSYDIDDFVKSLCNLWPDDIVYSSVIDESIKFTTKGFQ